MKKMPSNKKVYYPLTHAQKRIYYDEKMCPGTAVSTQAFIVRYKEILDKALLEQAINKVILRNDGFRLRIVEPDFEPEPLQYVSEFKEISPEEFDFTGPESERRMREWIERTTTIPFQLIDSDLFYFAYIKYNEKESGYYMKFHHIASDGWSYPLIFSEINKIYEDLKAGKTINDSPNPSYLPYIAEEQEYLISEQVKKDKEFWHNTLLPLPEPANLSTKTGDPYDIKGNGFVIAFPDNMRTMIHEYCKTNKTSLFKLILSALSIYVTGVTGLDEIVIASTNHNRAVDSRKKIVGMFVSTIPVRIKIDGNMAFNGLVKKVGKEMNYILKNHQKYPFDRLATELREISAADTGYLLDIFISAHGEVKKEIFNFEHIFQGYVANLLTIHINYSNKNVDGILELEYEYQVEQFSQSDIRGIHHGLLNVLKNALTSQEKKISEIDLLCEEEKKRILCDFNDTQTGYPKDKTIHRLFEEQVEKLPHNIALIFINEQLSYRELNKKANQLARVLIEDGVRPGRIVSLIVDRSIDMIIAILAVLKAGGAYLPILPEYPGERIKLMLADSSAEILITTKELEDKTTFEKKKIYIEDKIILKGNNTNTENMNKPTDTAYIIFTSGTTGKPKGVMIEHRNLVQLMFHDKFLFDFDSSDVWTMFHSYGFDFSVWEMYGSLLYGGKLVVIPKMVARETGSFLKLLKEKAVTVLNQTPSAFYNLINLELNDSSQKSDPGKLNIKYVFLGGEALTPVKLREWRRKYPDTKLVNMFGITETTVHVTFKEITGKEIETNISNIGIPLPTYSSYLMEKYLKLLPLGVAGECFVGGAGVARGYLNRPELTSEKFIENPYKPEEKLYRTGDLMKILKNGEMEYLGRIDNQVQIRGFRIELGEIESKLLNMEEIKEAVVLAKKNKIGDNYIWSYFVSEEKVDLSKIRNTLSEHLPDYMIPSYFIQIGKIPLTPNGKVDRKALLEIDADYSQIPYMHKKSPDEMPLTKEGKIDRKLLESVDLKIGTGYEAPRDDMEDKLAEIYHEVLQIEKDKISINESFFRLGGHSLKAAILVANMHKELDIKIPMSKIFDFPTIKQLSNYIKEVTADKAMEDKCISIGKVEEKEYYVLSSAQKRLFILDLMEGKSVTYNIPTLYLLEEVPDPVRLEDAFGKLIQRHESFRTSFEMSENEPVQKIHEAVDFEIEDLATGSSQLATNAIKNFIRPFDLSLPPLLRAGLLRTGEGNCLLMVDMHHIISDGISMKIFQRELTALYEGKELPSLRIRYKDYAQWLSRANKQRKKLKEEEAYWLKEFEGEIPVLNLPVDYERPVVQSFEGNTVTFKLSGEETVSLKKLAKKENFTLFMVLFTVFYILLGKLSGQEDIVVGTPTAGRRHAALENIIGMFVNTLALRNFPASRKSFREFLSEVKQRTLEAFDNQDYQFEDLVGQVIKNRASDRNPLFDVMFVLENIEMDQAVHSPLLSKPFYYNTQTSKFDMTLTVKEESGREKGENKLSFSLEYSTQLFKAGTIERIIGYFKRMVSGILVEPGIRIKDIEILPGAEIKRLLFDFNDTQTGYPKDKTIHQLFKKQVERTPDHTALKGQIPNKEAGNISVTYKELNRRSNQLAHLLGEKGVNSDAIVGLMVEPSVEMIVSIFGILKAGGAYLPIDPGYPGERINYMLADSKVGILVTTPKLQVKAEVEKNFNQPLGLPLQFVNIEVGLTAAFKPSSSTLTLTSTCQVSPANLAYLIYTSGTTGKPKGVTVEHLSVINILFALFDEYPMGETDGFLLKTSFVFDVSVVELFGWILGGSWLGVPEKGKEKDPRAIIDAIAAFQVTHINFVPSMFSVFLEQLDSNNIGKLSALKYIFLAGEACLPGLVKRFKQFNTAVRLENLYGPTEGTIYASGYSLADWKEENGNIPIGKPVKNVSIYILDRYRKLQPLGVVGDLYIGGKGLARGYLNNPGLTHESFIEVLLPAFPGFKCMFRTGDLARWLPDGNVEFLGRMDHQVKIRGFRIELGEIENQLLKHEDIKEAVVIDREESEGEKYLCAYIVSSKKLPKANLKKYLSLTLPDYMIPAHAVYLDRMPLTPTGKVDRRSLPRPEIVSETQFVAPRDAVEEKLAEIWAVVLGIDKKTIGIDDHFFHLGGHSLKATIVLFKIHQAFEVNLVLGNMFKTPSIRGLARCIHHAVRYEETFIPIDPVEKQYYYLLSSAQKRIYMMYQLEPLGTSYNMPTFLELEEEPDLERLEQTFRELIHRHESFRTSFLIKDDEPVQRVHEEVEFEIKYHIAERRAQNAERKEERHTPYAMHHASALKAFIRPFDLAKAPLLRVGLIKTGKRHMLMIDMHHIIFDGASMKLFRLELNQLYTSSSVELTPLPIQYKDYAQWQNREARKGILKKRLSRQETFWLREFGEGEIPVLDLPYDFPRPAIQSLEGEAISFEIDSTETQALKELAAKENVSLFMLLLAIFYILLNKISNQEDIVVGTPTVGRNHPDLQGIIGMFVNTLALRNFPSGWKSFREFLGEIKQRTLDAFDHQDYQFENLVDRVIINRTSERNPLFDVMFTLENIQTHEAADSPLQLKPFYYKSGTAKFDMILTVMEKSCGEGEKSHLSLDIVYCTRLFKTGTLLRIIEYFKRLAANLADDPGVKIKDVDILPGEERKRLLYDFNDTIRKYPEKTIHELFEAQVARIPDHTALAAPVGQIPNKKAGCGEKISITYTELNKRADQLAYVLKEKGAQADTIVGIMVERSIEMIIGILGILKSGGAYLPIEPEYPEERIDFMLKDSGAEILLTKKEIAFLPKGASFHLDLQPAPVTSLAYIIYTSGTTGNPKGVIVNHQNVARLVMNPNYIVFQEGDSILLTGALAFDASTFEIWGALLNGLKLVLTSKDQILNPQQLKGTIRTHDITTMWMTAPLFNQMLDTDIEIFFGLKNLLVGGDVLSPPHINRLRVRYPHLNIINGYGPTENTTFSTTFHINEPYTWRIPIGKPISNSFAYVVDKYDGLVPIGIFGELWVGGDGVARGYLNDPELTAEKFLPVFYRSYRSYMSYISKKIYKTGDLARWLPDGTIDFLGRIDLQVKIRGYRIEPGEIENHLLKHEKIKEAVVLLKEDSSGDKNLCAYIVPVSISTTEQPGGGVGYDTGIDIEELRKYLSQSLPDYMIPGFFIQVEEIPLTPNGKIDRKALPDPIGMETKGYYIPPRDKIEEKLVGIWSGILGIAGQSIGIDDNFFQLGGHSLKAAVMISRIHQDFNVSLVLGEIFKSPTIRGLARYIKYAVKDRFISIEPVEKKEYYPLSSAQKRIYVVHQLEPQGIGYNMPFILELEKEPDVERLEQAFKKLMKRHESFRTSFVMIDDQPVQRVHDTVEFEIEYYDFQVTGAGDRCRWEEAPHRQIPNPKFQIPNKEETKGHHSSFIIHHSFVRPFDLSKAPLLRVGLIKTGIGNKPILMMDMHHIISDGLSMEIFRQELDQLYASSLELSPLPIQYKDYSEWQNSEKVTVVMKDQEDFWLKTFAEELPLLNLPVDFPRPSIQSFRGSSISFTLDLRETGGLKEIAAARDITPFMLLLTITNILLAKVSNQEDIIVGVPLAGRRHAELGHMIGMFINTLALRNFPIGARKVSDFSREVGENSLGAFENQEYPFEELVEKLPLERDTSRNPLYDVVFSWLTRDTRWEDLLGMKVKPLPYEGNTAKFDLTLVALEPGPGQPFTFTFYFSTALFKKETIERFINYFKRVVSAVLENPDQTIAEIEILSGEERKQLLVNFNHTGGPYPVDQTLVELFEYQVDRIPDYTALIGQIPNTKEPFGRISAFGEMNLSYRVLNEQSNQLAHLLQLKGVKSGIIVAIMVERSIDMIIGILGILKAGAAYLPINPKNPGTRTQYMLEDSAAKILLDAPLTRVETSSSTLTSTSTCQVSPANLAYIIYTSGSTGKPKGVPITHANLSPLLHWGYCQFGLGTGDRILQNLSYFFDWSVWEIFITLTSGARLYMAAEEILLDSEACIAFMKEHKITVLHITPSQCQYLVHVPHKLEALRYLFIGAEKLTHELVKRSFASVSSQCRVFNMYGPTEATIISAVLEIDRSCFDVFKGLSSVPIGGPVGNMELFVLNKYLKLCPVNTAGELYIGGDGVAFGYLNNPELTSGKFINYKLQITNYKQITNYNVQNYKPNGHHTIMQSCNHAIMQPCSHASMPSPLHPITPIPQSPIYRTGDLARWLVDGAVEFLGRIDHQVKIRGYRIELGEIENQLLKHPGVKETTVVVKEDERGDKYLCAYIIKGMARVTAAQLKEYLTGLLPAYMVPAYFVFIEEIPLTPNGKVDWKALPDPETNGEGRDYIAPMDEVEERLASLWSGVLGIEENPISREDNFFELGGHSLKATRLISGIHKAFNVKLSLIQVFEVPQLKSMARSIKEAAPEQYSPIPLVEQREYYGLSFNQERLWFIHEQEPASPAYNMPGSFEMNHAVDEHALRKALNKIVECHESFRTGFKMVNDEPVQFILAEVEIPVQFMDISSMAEGEKQERKEQIFLEMSGKIFDLTEPPLLRVVLVRIGPACYDLMYNMHHIISDGWSLEVFKKEFFYFYEQYRGGSAVDMELLPLQYKDFALWYKHRIESAGQNHPSHRCWREKLEKGIPVLQLPRNTSGDKADVKGAEYRYLVDRDLKEKLKKLAATHNTTLFMVTFALYILVLRRYSNQQEIVTSIISAGRNHGALSDMIGFFVNSLLFTTHVEDDEPFEDFLQRVHTDVLECFKHQDYPLDLVVRQMNLRYPEIPVSFNMINLQEGTAEEEINVFKPFHIPNAHDVKFDIEPYIMEYKNGMGTWWSYKKSIFSPITIEYFVRDYIRLMEFFTTHPYQSYNDFRETVKSKKKKRKVRRGISQDL